MKQWVRVSRYTFVNLGAAAHVTFASDGHLERAFVHFAGPDEEQQGSQRYLDLVGEEARALKVSMVSGMADLPGIDSQYDEY